MKKARFTETQIVNILKLADSGMKVEDICRTLDEIWLRSKFTQIRARSGRQII